METTAITTNGKTASDTPTICILINMDGVNVDEMWKYRENEEELQ